MGDHFAMSLQFTEENVLLNVKQRLAPSFDMFTLAPLRVFTNADGSVLNAHFDPLFYTHKMIIKQFAHRDHP